jgi:hypothetical protein
VNLDDGRFIRELQASLFLSPQRYFPLEKSAGWHKSIPLAQSRRFSDTVNCQSIFNNHWTATEQTFFRHVTDRSNLAGS